MMFPMPVAWNEVMYKNIMMEKGKTTYCRDV